MVSRVIPEGAEARPYSQSKHGDITEVEIGRKDAQTSDSVFLA